MKYLVIIPDGAADLPLPDYDGKTVLEIATTPTLDAIAREGRLGLAQTVPEGMQPGSDVANLSLLGYDPTKGFSGRAALEAASQGVEVPDGHAVFRANLVTVSEDGKMEDYCAGHITTEEGSELIGQLNRDLGIDGVRFFPGISYRHLCIIEDAGCGIPECTPPHEIVGEKIMDYMPHGDYASWVLEVERSSAQLMPGYEVNLRRVAEGKRPATQVWLWGGATTMNLEHFARRHGLKSAGMISAVDLMRGIGTLAGMDVLTVPGATAYLDTNFAGKGRAALDYIYLHDFVLVHVEAPDEAGHNRDMAGKVKAIEDIDRHILAPIYAMAKHYGDWRIMIAPDHPTPVSTGKHSALPVPYVLWGLGFDANGARAFSEKEAARVAGEVVPAIEVMKDLTGKG